MSCDQTKGREHGSQRASSSAQLRKVSKPLVERRRRERINRSIDELKSLLVSRHQMIGASRLDKTEILELAVDELRNVTFSQTRSYERLTQPDVAYNAGYSACANEALRHLGDLDNISVTTRQRLVAGLSGHLRGCTATTDDDVTVTSPTMCGVTAATRRRLFDSTPRSDEGRRRRRPLADIQPSVRRDPPPVCRSTVAASNTDSRFPFQFPPPVVASFGGHMVSEEFPPALSTQVMSRCVTLTQTMTTTMQEDRQATTHRDTTSQALDSHDESDSRCLSTEATSEFMWRPW